MKNFDNEEFMKLKSAVEKLSGAFLSLGALAKILEKNIKEFSAICDKSFSKEKTDK